MDTKNTEKTTIKGGRGFQSGGHEKQLQQSMQRQRNGWELLQMMREKPGGVMNQFYSQGTYHLDCEK